MSGCFAEGAALMLVLAALPLVESPFSTFWRLDDGSEDALSWLAADPRET